MNPRDQVFGLYVPGHSWVHRLPVGAKFAIVLAVSLIPLVLRTPWATVALLPATFAVLAMSGVGWRRYLPLPLAFWVTAGLLLAYQLIWGTATDAVVVVGNLFVCLYASRILTLTTPVPVLLDGLVAGLGPLRVIGVDPERVGLAVALMLRSLPYLLGSFGEVRDAARARGLERNVLAQVSPVVINAVAYAKATGEALAARGIGEAPDDEPTRGSRAGGQPRS